MKTKSGIGGTGYNSSLENYGDLDNFQGELQFWNELLTNFRNGDVVQGPQII